MSNLVIDITFKKSIVKSIKNDNNIKAIALMFIFFLNKTELFVSFLFLKKIKFNANGSAFNAKMEMDNSNKTAWLEE
jgi:hypothetical protein